MILDLIAAVVFAIALLLVFIPLRHTTSVLEEEARLSEEAVPTSPPPASSLNRDQLRVIGGGSRGPGR